MIKDKLLGNCLLKEKKLTEEINILRLNMIPLNEKIELLELELNKSRYDSAVDSKDFLYLNSKESFYD